MVSDGISRANVGNVVNSDLYTKSVISDVSTVGYNTAPDCSHYCHVSQTTRIVIIAVIGVLSLDSWIIL